MEIKTNNFDSISYTGIIKVKLRKNGKIYRETIYHNNGRWPIFKNLTYSLAGNYTEADRWRPLVLEVYSVPKEFTDNGECPVINSTNTDTADPDNWKDLAPGEIRRYANADNLITAYPIQYYLTPKVTDTVENGIGTSEVQYKFMIPFNSLNLAKETDWNPEYKLPPLNLVCLYSKSNLPVHGQSTNQSITYGNPSAFYFVKDSNNMLTSLLPKEFTLALGEYDLIIEWTLKFSSK